MTPKTTKEHPDIVKRKELAIKIRKELTQENIESQRDWIIQNSGIRIGKLQTLEAVEKIIRTEKPRTCWSEEARYGFTVALLRIDKQIKSLKEKK